MGKIASTSSIICLMTGVVLYVCLCPLYRMHPFAVVNLSVSQHACDFVYIRAFISAGV